MRLERYRGTRLWGTPLSYIEVCLDYILKAAGIHMYIWWKVFMHDCVKEIRFERDKAEVVAVVVIWAKYCRVAVKQLKGRGTIRGLFRMWIITWMWWKGRERHQRWLLGWGGWKGHPWGRAPKRSWYRGGQWVQLWTWLLVTCVSSCRYWIWVSSCVHRYGVWTWAGVSEFQCFDLSSVDDNI